MCCHYTTPPSVLFCDNWNRELRNYSVLLRSCIWRVLTSQHLLCRILYCQNDGSPNILSPSLHIENTYMMSCIPETILSDRNASFSTYFYRWLCYLDSVLLERLFALLYLCKTCGCFNKTNRI